MWQLGTAQCEVPTAVQCSSGVLRPSEMLCQALLRSAECLCCLHLVTTCDCVSSWALWLQGPAQHVALPSVRDLLQLSVQHTDCWISFSDGIQGFLLTSSLDFCLKPLLQTRVPHFLAYPFHSHPQLHVSMSLRNHLVAYHTHTWPLTEPSLIISAIECWPY